MSGALEQLLGKNQQDIPIAQRRSAEKRQQLAAAKAELERLKAMKAEAESVRAKSPVEEELDAAMAERDGLLELKKEREERQRAEAGSIAGPLPAAVPQFDEQEKQQQLLLLPPTLVGTARAVPTEPASITRQEIELPNADELRRGGFAFVLHDVFSPAECAAMIAASEARGYDQALLNAGFAQVLNRSTRNSMRNIWDNHETAAEIHRRIAPYLPNEAERHSFGYPAKPALQKCEGLNERLRFLRYDPGDFFAAHQDGSYERPDRSACSYLTVMLYLNSGGDVDFSGGETSFVSRTGAQPDVALVPRAGDVLIFTHPVLHQGNKVTKGRKYAVRTDVMYSFNESGNGLTRTRARIRTSCFR